MKTKLKVIVKNKLTKEQKEQKIKEIAELLQIKYYS